MSESTGISWTQKTWNPWYGCHKISPGCAKCYMYRDMPHYGKNPSVVVRSKTTFNDPLKPKWREPAKVFTCSWSDFFIEEADAWRDEAWDIIRRTPHLTYQILTKRPERIIDHLPHGWPLPNVWLGISAENQAMLQKRMLPFLVVPAYQKFISYEPALSELNLRRIRIETGGSGGGAVVDLVNKSACSIGGSWPISGITWLIVGAESGAKDKRRPTRIEWVRSIRDQCKVAGVALWVKQLEINGRVTDDVNDFPADLRIQEFPR